MLDTRYPLKLTDKELIWQEEKIREWLSKNKPTIIPDKHFPKDSSGLKMYIKGY